MKKALAVALLDLRRLGFGLVSGALVAGLIPALASGLGEKAPAATILVLVLAVVGIAAGGYFGMDFADGRSSFFFARPLPTWALIGGRLAGLLALAAGAILAFMTSYWLSSSDRSQWSLLILGWDHAAALGTGWAVSLFMALAHAAQGPAQRYVSRPRDIVAVPLRMGVLLGAALVTFGLFADLVLRAYMTRTPAKIFFGSWIAASFIASCVAIAAGRTERLRISRFQNAVIFSHVALACAGLVAAWTYVLHPGPSDIERVRLVEASPDGRSAYVRATVNRGDARVFEPVFLIDIASGRVHRLDADPGQGPWVSADGGTVAWSEATPFFFRPLNRWLGGFAHFRVTTSAGGLEALPIPKNLPPDGFTTAGGAMSFGALKSVLPSPSGDLFAIEWGRHLTFTSHADGELSDLDLGASGGVQARVFLPGGDLRAALVRKGTPAGKLEIVDIRPRTGHVETLAAVEAARVRFDPRGERAFLTSGTRGGRASISVADLRRAPDTLPLTVLLADGINPVARFLADGRIVATTLQQGPVFRVFSAAGQPTADIPVSEPSHMSVAGEMFPGVLAVSLNSHGAGDLGLVDLATGAIVRRLPNLRSPLAFSAATPPPGTPAARLLQSNDGRLYELPSIGAESRLLLPIESR
jgi:hypothetical protein